MMTPRSPRDLLSFARRARGRRLRRSAALATTAAVVAAVATAATPMAAGAAAARADDAARAASRAWSPFFEHQRPVTTVDARRMIVTFDDPSLGEWIGAGQQTFTAKQRATWLRKAKRAQQARLDGLAAAGVSFTVEHRYLRVLNGASLLVHGDGAQLLGRMQGVTHAVPVRTVWPAAIGGRSDSATSRMDGAAGAAAAAGVAPGARHSATRSSGDGAIRVAVLDTALDATHPAVAGRVGDAHDATGSQRGPASTPDAHGTAVAGAVLRGAGADVNVELLPVEVLEQRPARNGVETVLGDSDDLLAGLEHAATVGADVAVIAAGTPYAGFTDSIEDRAVRAASALGTVVVAAAGNDGASGDAVGTVGSVAASRDALTVGAADLRAEVPVAELRIRGGGIDETLRDAPILSAGEAKLPSGELKVVAVDGVGDEVVDYLDAELRSRVAGAVALVAAREDVLVAQQVRAAADAGAIAVIVAADGAGAAAAAGTIDVVGADVPAIGLGREDAGAVRAALRGGERLALTMRSSMVRNPAHGSVAGFSSAGPRLDGIGRPDLLAPGVGMVVAGADGSWQIASGTSIAAAWAAGQAAAVRASQPAWTSEDVRAAMVGSATPLGSNRNRAAVSLQGAGVADAARAAKVAVQAGRAGRIDFGAVTPGERARVQLDLRGADGAPVASIGRLLLDDGGRPTPPLTLDGDALVLDVATDAAAGHVGGWLVLEEHGIRVPWSATIRDAAAVTAPMRASVSNRILERVAGPGAYASTLTLAIGSEAVTSGTLGLGAVQRLEVRLVDAKGKDRGAIGQLEHALPGVYSFGLRGVDASGKRLKAGTWQLKVRYVPAADPRGEWRDGPTTTIAVRGAKRK